MSPFLLQENSSLSRFNNLPKDTKLEVRTKHVSFNPAQCHLHGPAPSFWMQTFQFRRHFDTQDFALCCFHCEHSVQKKLQKGGIQQSWASAVKFTVEQKSERDNMGLRYRSFGSSVYSGEFCSVWAAKHVPF